MISIIDEIFDILHQAVTRKGVDNFTKVHIPEARWPKLVAEHRAKVGVNWFGFKNDMLFSGMKAVVEPNCDFIWVS